MVWDTRGMHDISLGSGTRSVTSSAGKAPRSDFTFMDDIDLTPTYRRQTSCNVWLAFLMQLFASLLVFIVFWSPGWGRTRESDTSDGPVTMHGDYGLWFICYHPVLESTAVACRPTLAFPMPSECR